MSANAVADLLGRGMEASACEASVKALESRAQELQRELNQVKPALDALYDRLPQVLGACKCGRALTGEDFLIKGICPKCKLALAGSLAGSSGEATVNRHGRLSRTRPGSGRPGQMLSGTPGPVPSAARLPAAVVPGAGAALGGLRPGQRLPSSEDPCRRAVRKAIPFAGTGGLHTEVFWALVIWVPSGRRDPADAQVPRCITRAERGDAMSGNQSEVVKRRWEADDVIRGLADRPRPTLSLWPVAQP
jgi:hypothetical protein